MFKYLIISFYFIANTQCFSQDTIKNSMNRIDLIQNDSIKPLSFMVAGHLYGAHSESIYPSSSVVNNIDKFKNSDFIVLLGDNYRFIDSLHISNFQTKFLKQFNIPIFNAIGNHDISSNQSTHDYNSYSKLFNKQTYFSFSTLQTLFIFLDTEIHIVNAKSNGSITGEQLLFLKNTLSLNKQNKNIIIFTHKELNLWNNNYKDEIEPLLITQSLKGKSIYVISGDMGKYSPDTYFITDPISNINYIHTHISDNRNDNILKCKINLNGDINIEVISLESFSRKKIYEYEYLNKPNTKAVPTNFEKIINKLKNKNYLLGILSALILFLIILLTKKMLIIFFKSK